jgi:hypothetical protein
MQPSKSTIQSHHASANPQLGFYLNPHTTCPVTHKEQMTMGLLLSTEHTGGIKRNEPQSVTGSKLSQDS